MSTQQTDALQCAADLEYSIARHGMQDAFTLNAYKAMKMVRTQHARIIELEAQLESIGAGGVRGQLMGQPQAMPDLSQLTERGAKAWAGVDAQALREGFAALAAGQAPAAPAQPAAQQGVAYAGMGHTDGGRNMFYEGRFDGESQREQQARLRWANDMRAAFERHTGNGWFDKDWRTETGLWSSAWHACLAAQPTTTAQSADSVPAVSDLPPLPAPATQQAGERVYAFRRKGLDDFCTCDEARYEELSNKPHLFETRIFYTAPQPAPAPLSDDVAKDAARYRWLREGNDAKHGAAWHVAVNLYGCEWDAAIDAARKRGASHEQG